MASYYNEFDPNAAAWLRQLIADKQIPYGHVDDRSITEVTASDLRGFTQAHWFAGVAGWPLALRLAGWPDDRPVWTASLPCQPFSSAGKQAGTDDERHLWPVFQRLVSECRPPAIFGEQVASKIAREKWFPGVCLDLQAMGYPVTALDLCAPCAGEDGEGRTHRGDIEPIVIGAPHIRQRLYWVAYRGVAYTDGGRHGTETGYQGMQAQDGQELGVSERDCISGRMAQPRNDGAGSLAGQARHEGRGTVDTGAEGLRQDHGTACTGGADPRGAGSDADSRMADTSSEQELTADPRGLHAEPSSSGGYDRMADTPSDRRERAGQGAEAEEGRQPRPKPRGELPSGSEGRGLHHWKRVSFAADCLGGDDEEPGDECSICGLTYAEDCECPGPTHDGYEYAERDGILYARRMADTHGEQRQQGLQSNEGRQAERIGSGGECLGVGNTDNSGREEHRRFGELHIWQREGAGTNRLGIYSGFSLVPCRDGKARRVESGVKPLVAGIPRGVVPSCDPGAPGYANETSEARVMRLKGYGNSIVAPLAAMFIETCMEVIPHD